MPDALGRVPSAPTVDGTRYTTDALLKDPKRLARVITPTPEIFLSTFLFRSDTTSSGAVIFNQARANGSYPEKGRVEEIAPGADFPKLDLSEETVDVTVATKHGIAFEVKDESVDRKSYDEVNRALLLAQNAMVLQNANQCYRAFLDAGVPTVNAVGAWNAASADPRRDIRKAQAQIRNTKLGYRAATVLINPDALLELELNPLFAGWMPRENANLNPFLNQGLNGFLNVEWVENEFVPEDEIFILQRNVTGVDVLEKDTSVEAHRQTGQKTLYEVSRRNVPIITDPLSVVRVQGVLA